MTANQFTIPEPASLLKLLVCSAYFAAYLIFRRIFPFKTEALSSCNNKNIEEDILWKNDLAPELPELCNNVKNILLYGYTEMVNNVIDHSGADTLTIFLRTDALHIEILIYDNGIGIFRKIKDALGLEQKKHAILELAKGKFTSDPENHSGEGIFFTSRTFDYFKILSHKSATSGKAGGLYCEPLKAVIKACTT